MSTTATTAYIEVRSQHAKGTWPAQGPDTYVAVQIVPAGVVPLQSLRSDTAKKRGIEIIYCGEGYRKNSGPRSALGRAMTAARNVVDNINDNDN